MAVAVDAKSTAVVNDTGGGTSYTGTANITVGSSLTNGFLAIIALWDHSAGSTTCHWDSSGTNQSAPSKGAATNSSGALRVEIFGVVNPTPGSKNVNLTWTGTGNELQIFAISWSGVDQTTPTGTAQVTNNGTLGNGATATLTVSSATIDAVLAAFVNDFAWATSPTNNTALWALNGITEGGCGAYALPGSASVSMTAKNGTTGDNYAAIALDIIAASTGTAVTSDSGSPFEFAGSLRSDGSALLEYLASVQVDSVLQAEAIRAVSRDGAGLPEFVEGLSAGIASQLEFLGSMRGDNLGPLEAAAALRSDVILLMETSAGQRADMMAATEIMASLRADLVGPMEITGAFRSDAVISIEATAATKSDATAQQEIAAGVTPQSGARAEILAGVQGNSPVEIENQGGVAVTGNAAVQLETAARLNFDQAASVEMLSSARRDQTASAEVLAGLSGQGAVDLEALAGSRSDAAAQAEFAGAIAVTGNAATPIEIAAAARADSNATVEATVALHGDQRAQAESVAKAQSDVIVNEEVQAGVAVSASAPAPIEITGRFSSFIAALVEIVQTAVVVPITIITGRFFAPLPVNPSVAERYRTSLERFGIPVTVTRTEGFAPNVAPFSANVKAIVRNYAPDRRAVSKEGGSVSRPGAITIGQRTVILLACDLRAQGFALPMQKNDTITLPSGDVLNVDAVDPFKRAQGGAIELKASGVS